VPKRKLNKADAFAWVAYMFTHESAEIKHVLKYGTPSERFIKIAEQPVGMTLADGKFKLITFPESLNKSAGQKLLFNAVQRIDLYLKTIPQQAYDLLQQVKTTVRHRRADTQSNIYMVAEAICHRAASEFKHEVLFAFDSINVWMNAVYHKELSHLTIRKALELLQEKGFIRVNEWGKRGARSRCTKIEIIPAPEGYIFTYTSNVDDWLLFNDHAMMAVYRRESVTRQDVLASKFQHFIEKQSAEQAVSQKVNEFYAKGTRLFGRDDDTISGDVTTTEEEDHEFEIYFDRLLGSMVQSVCEDGTGSREVDKRVGYNTS
jgi:hypothetical protein